MKIKKWLREKSVRLGEIVSQLEDGKTEIGPYRVELKRLSAYGTIKLVVTDKSYTEYAGFALKEDGGVEIIDVFRVKADDKFSEEYRYLGETLMNYLPIPGKSKAILCLTYKPNSGALREISVQEKVGSRYALYDREDGWSLWETEPITMPRRPLLSEVYELPENIADASELLGVKIPWEIPDVEAVHDTIAQYFDFASFFTAYELDKASKS